MAQIHISNTELYEEIKNFVIYPFQATVTEQYPLTISKSTGECRNDSKFQNSLHEILTLHQNCSKKNRICFHLVYLLRKVRDIHRSWKWFFDGIYFQKRLINMASSHRVIGKAKGNRKMGKLEEWFLFLFPFYPWIPFEVFRSISFFLTLSFPSNDLISFSSLSLSFYNL